MSRELDSSDYNDRDFELGEEVSFDYRGERLHGEVVRVYNTRTLYHVIVAGRRYEVEPGVDNMLREYEDVI